MRRQTLDYICATCRHCARSQNILSRTRTTGRRYVQISATPASSEPQQSLDTRDPASGSSPAPDARFEVLGNSFSLLSASISASQNLYTRKGTLVGFNGQPENAISTLSLLSPIRRLPLAIPFIYQRISSTTPYTALISTKSPLTSLVVVHLDGRLDWMITQRNALLAWTGQNLKLSPRMNTKMTLAHWGNTHITGRGLLALTGRGLTHQITLKSTDEYIVHPAHVVAYSMGQQPPQPYRFKSSSLRFQIPNPFSWLPETRFWRTMRETAVWRAIVEGSWRVRTWVRRTVWGDRLFLHFRGPGTILLQSRGARLKDILSTREVNEMAESPAGAVPRAIAIQSAADASGNSASTSASSQSQSSAKGVSYASVNREGTVKFDEVKE